MANPKDENEVNFPTQKSEITWKMHFLPNFEAYEQQKKRGKKAKMFEISNFPSQNGALNQSLMAVAIMIRNHFILKELGKCRTC